MQATGRWWSASGVALAIVLCVLSGAVAAASGQDESAREVTADGLVTNDEYLFVAASRAPSVLDVRVTQNRVHFSLPFFGAGMVTGAAVIERWFSLLITPQNESTIQEFGAEFECEVGWEFVIDFEGELAAGEPSEITGHGVLVATVVAGYTCPDLWIANPEPITVTLRGSWSPSSGRLVGTWRHDDGQIAEFEATAPISEPSPSTTASATPDTTTGGEHDESFAAGFWEALPLSAAQNGRIQELTGCGGDDFDQRCIEALSDARALATQLGLGPGRISRPSHEQATAILFLGLVPTKDPTSDTPAFRSMNYVVPVLGRLLQTWQESDEDLIFLRDAPYDAPQREDISSVQAERDRAATATNRFVRLVLGIEVEGWGALEAETPTTPAEGEDGSGREDG